jgi:hypothetical protein
MDRLLADVGATHARANTHAAKPNDVTRRRCPLGELAEASPSDRAEIRETSRKILEAVRADESVAKAAGLTVVTVANHNPLMPKYVRADVDDLLCQMAQEIAALLEAQDRAAERLVFCMRIYNGHRTDARGPAGCLIDALEAVSPAVAKTLREGIADAHDVYEMNWPDEVTP